MMAAQIELRCLVILVVSLFLVGCGGIFEDAREYNLGTEALEQGDYSTAIQHLENAVDSNPSRSEYRHSLACAYLEIDDLAKGWPHVRKSLVVGQPNLNAIKNFERFWDRFTDQGSLDFGHPSREVESALGPPDKREREAEIDLYYYGQVKNPLIMEDVYLRTLAFYDGKLAKIRCHYLPHMPRQIVHHDFDGREWATGNEGVDGTQAITELVTDGEAVTNWTELVTRHVIFTSMPVEFLADDLRSAAPPDCVNFKLEVTEHSPREATIEWSHDGNAVLPAEREIRCIFLGKDGMYNLSYTVKGEGYRPERFAQWREIISAAELVDRGDPE